MNDIIMLKEIYCILIWGYERLLISGHPHGDNKIIDDNIKLSDFYHAHKEKFGNTHQLFPLIIKIIEAEDNLSIHVHPDDKYARIHVNELGKASFWYVLNAKKNSEVIIGIDVENKEQLKELIENDTLNQRLNKIQVKKGDFIYIPPGCIHSIGRGIKILEVQQASDITYRFYDYNRVGFNGNLRKLDIEKGLEVIDYNYKYNKCISFTKIINNLEITTLIDNQYFTIEIIKAHDYCVYENKYNFITAIALNDTIINDILVKEEQGFIIPKNVNINLESNSILYIAYIKGGLWFMQ